jgi:single-strand DNA-binding protein
MSNVFSGTGNVARDAELKNINGQSLLSFVVANSIGFGDKKTTLWLDCSLWGKRAESVAAFVKKGQSVFVSGELTTREYQAKDGSGTKTTLSINITVLDLVGKKSDNPQPQPAPAPVATYTPPHEQHRQAVAAHNQQMGEPYDDDIPF